MCLNTLHPLKLEPLIIFGRLIQEMFKSINFFFNLELFLHFVKLGFKINSTKKACQAYSKAELSHVTF